MNNTAPILPDPNAALSFPDEWLGFPVSVADPGSLQRLVCEFIGGGEFPRFFLQWDAVAGELNALWHRKRTAKRLGEAEECGTSFSEALAEAADYFGISYSTLHRIVRPPKRSGRNAVHVSAGTFYKLRKKLNAEPFQRQLDVAVLGERGIRIVREYLAFIERETSRFQAHRHNEDRYSIFPRQEWKPRSARAPRKTPDWVARVTFWKQVSALGLPAPRARLGDLRVYDGVVGWSRLRCALKPKDTRRLVTAGYRRETRLVRAEARLLRESLTSQTVRKRKVK